MRIYNNTFIGMIIGVRTFLPANYKIGRAEMPALQV